MPRAQAPTAELLEHRTNLHGLHRYLVRLTPGELARAWVGLVLEATVTACNGTPALDGLGQALYLVQARLHGTRGADGGRPTQATLLARAALHRMLPNAGDEIRYRDAAATFPQGTDAGRRAVLDRWLSTWPEFRLERRLVPLSEAPKAVYLRRNRALKLGHPQQRRREYWIVRVPAEPGTMTTMATHTTNPVTVLSETASVPAAGGDNNLVANPTGHTFILVRNADGAIDSTVTIAAVATMRPGEPHRWPQTVVPNIAVLCPHGEMRLIGPIPEAYNDAAGFAHLSFSSVVNVSVIAFSTPR